MFVSERKNGPKISPDFLTQHLGDGFCCPRVAPHRQVMEGLFFETTLRHGLGLQGTDIIHLCDLETRYEHLPPGFKIIVKLEGDAQVRLDRVQLELDAGIERQAKPVGCLVRIAQPVVFERQCSADTRERMVVITLGQEWFDATQVPFPLADAHLSQRAWAPSRRTLAAVEQLLQPGDLDDPVQRLRMEGHALEIITDALSQMTERPREGARDLPPVHYQRACRLQRLLDSGEADTLSLTEMSSLMGCNAQCLQHQFRLAFGTTIFDYLRDSRLQRAARALEQDNVSVTEAADIAGYKSPANFSTAFRKRFGIPPKSLRIRQGSPSPR